MGKHITIIQGHPDPAGRHLGHAMADAYAEGARAAGHAVEEIDVAALGLPLLHSREDWEKEEPPEPVKQAQAAIGRADHLLIVYPLWLGSMPAVLKGFLEQVFRPGFAIAKSGGPGLWTKRLAGKTARIVVTMGMPALAYRWFFRAHSLKSLERNILRFCGIRPIGESLLGNVEGASDAKRHAWLAAMRRHGSLAN